MTNRKMKTMFAYDDAVKDGNLLAAQRILRLLSNGQSKFYCDDADWDAEVYLCKRGLAGNIDRRGNWTIYSIAGR